MRIARAAGLSTADARDRFTLRRGSLLRFDDGACIALDGVRCSIHQGRPLACRLYPLGIERAPDGVESFIRLEPAPASRGVYGVAGSIADFIRGQELAEYLAAHDGYRELLAPMQSRIGVLVDFERVEPREFWRVAMREALAESNFDPNPLLDALYDPDGLGCACAPLTGAVVAHLAALRIRIEHCDDAPVLAAAAALLAVSLGYPPPASSHPAQLIHTSSI